MANAKEQRGGLEPAQRRKLRSLGHHLEPVVHLGKNGVSESLLEALEQALLTHEPVKVRLNQNVMMDRNEAAETLAARTGADVAQILGTTVLLFRPHPDEPKIFP